MYFQLLDIKNQCLGYYTKGEFFYKEPLFDLTKTWDYSPALKGRSIEYARIYAGGKSLTEVCPERYKNLWDTIKKKIQVYLKALHVAKLNLDEVCLYDLIPEYSLFEFADLKNEITRHVLETYERPTNYDLMVDILELMGDIRQQPLNVSMGPIKHKLGSRKGKNFARRMRDSNRICDYNPWGTITGRLAGTSNSFPLLTLNKEFRECLQPTNDWFIELDYNAAEVRTLLALSGCDQPQEDIHEWNNIHIYDGKLTRDEAKQKIFAWLYSKRSNKRAEQYYNKNKVLQNYWRDGIISTEFDREIRDVEEHYALNYIIQSTTSDLVLSKAVDINKKLQPLKSNLAFTLHDSIVIDLKNEDRYLIPDLIKLFGETRFGAYKVNVSAGKNFGELRKMNL